MSRFTPEIQVIQTLTVPPAAMNQLKEGLNRMHGWMEGVVPLSTPKGDVVKLTEAHRRLATVPILTFNLHTDKTGKLFVTLEDAPVLRLDRLSGVPLRKLARALNMGHEQSLRASYKELVDHIKLAEEP